MGRIIKTCALWLCALALCTACLAARAADDVPVFDGKVEITSLDGKAAFARYVDRLFGADEPAPRRSGAKGAADSAASKLSAEARAAYDILVPLLRDVAEGRSASTVFDISAAMMPKSERGLLFQALISDLPYEIYWVGEYYATASMGEIAVRWFFYPSFAYQPADYDDNAPTVDLAKTGAALGALSNAQSLAAEAAAKGCNLDKLNFIKQTVCDLVTYNYDALAPGFTASDYDPWQIIYVFDEDPDTNVVCEGYAKAFKYLCDNADLVGASAMYVDGYFAGDSGDAGGHAWNIVQMANGRNYLVDLTHCDQDDWGFIDERRFLAGGTGSPSEGYSFVFPQIKVTIDGTTYLVPSSTATYYYYDEVLALWNDELLTLDDAAFSPDVLHVWGDAQTIQQEDCYQDGILLYTCADCGATDQYVFPSTGHSLFYHTAKEPTCTEPGWDEYYTCTRCDYSTYTEIPATGHSMVNFPGQAATCTEDGWEPYEVCTGCGLSTYAVIPAAGHDVIYCPGQPATCIEGGWEDYEYCTRCDYTTYAEIAPEGHDIVTCPGQSPSCTEDGWEDYEYCTRCEYTTYTAIAAPGHAYITFAGQAPTCTESGWEDYAFCVRCNQSTYTEIPPLGHDFVHHAAKAPTATEPGWEAYDTCTRCTYSTYVEIAPTGGGTTVRRGDVSGDGKVNGKDVTMMQRFVAGGYGVTLDISAADLTGDSKVNGKDVTKLQRFLAGGYGVSLD